MESFSFDVDPKEEAVAIFLSRIQKTIISIALQKKINQTDLAKKLEITRSEVHKMLREKGNITLKALAEICWALNIEPELKIYDNDDVIEQVVSHVEYLTAINTQLVENHLDSLRKLLEIREVQYSACELKTLNMKKSIVMDLPVSFNNDTEDQRFALHYQDMLQQVHH